MKLDERQIRSAIATRGVDCRLALLPSVDSTNRWLMQHARSSDGQLGTEPYACVAEQQTDGRGRRGRSWLSEDDGLAFSLLRHFHLPPLRLSGLSLVAGVAIASRLKELGAQELGLKWPNDLLWRGRKVGGILIEVVGAREHECSAITGIGINYARLPEVDQPIAALSEAFNGAPPPPSVLLGELLAAVAEAFAHFEQAGFAPFQARWAELDLLAGREVDVQAGSEWLGGRALGVADDGALRVQVDGREERFSAGEVSLRLAP